MTIKKQALDLIGVSVEQYLDYCERYNLKPNFKKTRREFFKRVSEGRIVLDTRTGQLIAKRPRGEDDEKQED